MNKNLLFAAAMAMTATTATRFLPSIYDKGILCENRQYVHLSPNQGNSHKSRLTPWQALCVGNRLQENGFRRNKVLPFTKRSVADEIR